MPMKQMLNIIILSILIILLFNSIAMASIDIKARAYLLGDFETGEILEGYNISQPIEIASISKLMTYVLVMDHINSGYISFDDRVYIDKDVTKITGGSLDLREGEVFSVYELVKASLVVSANDATYALAKHIAGTEEDFVVLMNKKAKEIGLNSAVFVNSSGLPKGKFQNAMSTEDIFKLSIYILDKYPEILSLTTIPYIEVQHRDYKKDNTNPLLNEIKDIDGLKTGSTIKAGFCLVSTINIKGDDIKTEDNRLISIVMGCKSEDERKEFSKILVQYGMNTYSKRILINKDYPIGYMYIDKNKDKQVEVYPSENFSMLCRKDDEIKRDIIIDDTIKLPLKSMDRIGEIVLTRDGHVLDKIDLVVIKEVKKDNLITKILGGIKTLIKRIISIILKRTSKAVIEYRYL